MSLTTQQISERLLKKTLGVAETNYPWSVRPNFSEKISSYSLVKSDAIWVDAVMIPSTPPTLSNLGENGVVRYYNKLLLEIVDNGTSVSFKSPNNELTDAIDSRFGFGYNFKLYNNNGSTQIYKGDWLVDSESGIITFYNINDTEEPINSSSPPRISFYKYIGNKGENLTYLSGLTSNIQTQLDSKENKNTSVVNYYVNNYPDFIYAWNRSIDSTLPVKIYASGTISLTGDTVLTKGVKDIEVIGTPIVAFDLGGYNLTTSSPIFENVMFKTPSFNGYVKIDNGYGTFKNVLFWSDVIDDPDVPKIPSLLLVDTNIRNGTGSIILDGVRHATEDANHNNGFLIQPIWILLNNPDNGYGNLYIKIKNVDPISGFYRFSRVLISNSESSAFVSKINVSGDETWFFHPSQEFEGQGLFSSDSIIRKIASIDELNVGRMSTGDTATKLIGVSTDGKAKIIDAGNILTSAEINITTGSTDSTYPNPLNYKNGDEWTDSSTLIKYTLYDDGDNKQWVVFEGTNSSTNTGGAIDTSGLYKTTGGPINGYVVASGFTGSGFGLTNIPLSGVTKQSYTATLYSSGWTGNQQSVTCNGLLGNSDIIVSPSPSSYINSANAQIYASSQSLNSVTFTCVNLPSVDIIIYIKTI